MTEVSTEEYIQFMLEAPDEPYPTEEEETRNLQKMCHTARAMMAILRDKVYDIDDAAVDEFVANTQQRMTQANPDNPQLREAWHNFVKPVLDDPDTRRAYLTHCLRESEMIQQLGVNGLIVVPDIWRGITHL